MNWCWNVCVYMCEHIYYTHVNRHTYLGAFHMPKSFSLSSSNHLPLMAFLHFMLSSLSLKDQMSLLRLHCLWYSKLWVSSQAPPFFLSLTSAKVAFSPLVPTHLPTDRISRIRFLNSLPAQTHSVAP